MAHKLAFLSHIKLKNPDKALTFYRQIINLSNNKEEIKEAQKNRASIYFYQKLDYDKALYEYEKLLQIEDKTFYRLQVARCYFYKESFRQALLETDKILKKKLSRQNKFEVLFLRANVFFTQKKSNKAIDLYKKLIGEFRELSLKNRVYLQLSLVYEQHSQYSQAISLLKQFKSRVQSSAQRRYLEERVQRLEERKKLAPRGI